MPLPLRLLSESDVRRAVTMPEAIEAMRLAFGQLSAGEAVAPVRTAISVEPHGGTALFMPAYLKGSNGLGAKLVSVFAGNVDRGLPTIAGVLVMEDASTGRPIAVIEAGYLTALRTGAASGLATALLARPEASILALFGAGAQARTQLEAVAAVRTLREVRVVTRDPAHAAAFIEAVRGQPGIPEHLVASSPDEALHGADVVVTATTATTPVFAGEALAAGAHVNAIGSHTAQARELDETSVLRSQVVVDSRAACLQEAGDLLLPIQAGLWSAERIHAELGEIVLGRATGRTSSGEVTLFKSVGLAVQDIAVGQVVLRKAEAMGLGRLVEL